MASLVTLGRRRSAQARGPWGPLIPDPNGVLDLPEGFSYMILEDAGQEMSDGYRLPARPDGMACFAGPDDTLIILRNHENNLNADADGPYFNGQPVPPEAYDPEGMGGVTRLVVDATTYERISSNLVLTGTVRNCAGGPSPWGWLSCEENVEINGDYRHGYTFLCPADAEVVQPAQAIVGYGRCNHEAVCIDPSNNYAYLTEDRGDSCLYRFVPASFDAPFEGKLQAMRVVGTDGYNTILMDVGAVFEVDWVDIDTPDPDTDTLRDEAKVKGAAIIVRAEGIWFFEGQIYICSSSGGPIGKGQIFRLIDGDSPTLELIVRSEDASVLNNPDNITVAPWGEVFLVEDAGGNNYMRWITAQGEVCDFARNVLSDSEMCGVCFSPDGKALFVNIQSDGLTLVITGPFPGTEPGGDGDGDGDPGDGDGDPAEGGEDETDGSEAGEGETGDGTGAGGDAGIDEGEGCSCSTDPQQSGVGAALTLAAVAGLAALTRKPDAGDAI